MRVVSTVLLILSLLGVSFGVGPRAASTAPIAIFETPPPEKFDEYGFISVTKENRRLDRFVKELQRRLDVTCYILVYGKYQGEGEARANRIKNYLIERRGINHYRVEMESQYCREDPQTQIWIIPPGTVHPAPGYDGGLQRCKVRP